MEIAENVNTKLDYFVEKFKDLLGDYLVGIYLHGSLAMDCFNPKSSDVDLLVVVKKELPFDLKEKLWAIMQELNLDAPGKGYEMSIVTEDSLKNFTYPTPYEFHFSYDHKNKEYKESKEADPDLAAHFVITKKRGLCLYGAPIANIFPDISGKYYLKSISQDAQWSFNNIEKGADKGTCKVPAYGVLNFCRVLAYIEDGMIASKKEGGEWAFENFPKEYSAIIEEALNDYAGNDSSEVDTVLLKKLSRYSWEKIEAALKKFE